MVNRAIITTACQPPFTIFITGPTASGKSDLAMRIASGYDGEIICADSQTVRKGMDIGTAKPSSDDQMKVRHHMLDLIDPYDRFTVADFKLLAEDAVSSIRRRNKLPIVVGGTGLYIDALLYDFSFRQTTSEYSREELEDKTVDALQAIINSKGYAVPENSRNPRHLIRTIEAAGELPQKRRPKGGSVIVGIDPGKEELERRIGMRATKMLECGLYDEYDDLVNKYGPPPSNFDALVYRMLQTNPDISKELIAKKMVISDRRYAKKQRAWMSRNKDIKWFVDSKQAYEYLSGVLGKTVE